MYANRFFAQVEYNGGLAPFIGIIALSYFGPNSVGATGHIDWDLFQKNTLYLPQPCHIQHIWNRVYLCYQSIKKIHRKIYFYLQLLTFSF